MAVLKSKTMWKVMLCGGLSVGAAILLNSYAVTAFIGKGMEPAAASVIATIMNFCLLIGGLVAGFIVSRWGFTMCRTSLSAVAVLSFITWLTGCLWAPLPTL